MRLDGEEELVSSNADFEREVEQNRDVTARPFKLRTVRMTYDKRRRGKTMSVVVLA